MVTIPTTAELSIEQRIGQVLATAVGHASGLGVNVGDAVADDQLRADAVRVAEEINSYGLGGVCWFPGRPGGNPPEQVAELITLLESAATVPLLVSTDQEGGRVARMREGFEVAPAARELAGDLEAIRAHAVRTAQQLRAVGVNHVLAPVADVDSNPDNPVIADRAYSSDPHEAARCVVAAVEGFTAGGVASCVKHFPGHGDTATDSHVDLPVVTATLEQWRTVEAVPFEAAVRAGVPSVMSGHLLVPAFDDQPGTFSRRLLTGVLREEWAYDGVVVSDSLLMDGATRGRTTGEIVVDALNAGVDQLLMPASMAEAHTALVRALDEGRVTEQRLNEACDRVLRLKRSLV
ncbi:glycoside hydrolase family 3 protein [Propionibacteriaceae bacterium Y1700]|uniref:glycoside hydrolase family 3 protein n=1 Tax=Microlunatus sp. Y1700 TaxID=3418487 RepID=UPI003DA77965